MRITSVAIDGVGRFGTPAKIEGLRSGVNILAADNEAGKSTFFRSIRTCLFERHGSKNAEVTALASEGLSLPVTITLCFDHDQKAYQITKSFVRSPSASLRCEGIEIARNRDADEKLWEILGISQSGSRSVDEAAFGILWVSQGQSFNVPEPTEAAASTLNAAIQAEVGTLVGGERARLVLTKLSSEISKQLTDKEKPKANGALAQSINAADGIRAELSDANSQLSSLDRSLDELEVLGGELKRLVSPIESARLVTELDEAHLQLKASENAATILARYQLEEEQILGLLIAQKEQYAALRILADRIDDSRLRSKQIEDELSPLDADEILSRSQLTDAINRIKEFDDRITLLDSQARMLQRIEILIQKEASQKQLRSQLEKLQDYDLRLFGAEAALKANHFDIAAVEELDNIERDVLALHAALKAGAAQLTIERTGISDININGMVLRGNTLRAVTEPLAILINKTVSITISPPLANVEQSRQKLTEFNDKLSALLRRYGSATVEDFRVSHRAFSKLEDSLRDLKAEGKALGLKGQPRSEIARMTAELEGIGAELGNLLEAVGKTTLPLMDEVVAERTSIELERDQLRNDRIHHEGLVSGHNASLTSLSAKRGILQGQLSELGKQLLGDLKSLPDDQRQATMATSERDLAKLLGEHKSKTEMLAEIQRNTPHPDEIERNRNRVNRLTEAKNNKEQKITEINQRIAHLEGQVLISGGEGLGEKSASLNERLIVAENEVARQKFRVQTSQYLYDIVKKSYDKRREELHAPLRRHLQPFLNDVFPQSEIEIGDGFAVSGLKRRGLDYESFSRLSDGTKEQIAVLVRLAMGAMICEKNHEVPIILDDALVFSDDKRIEQMFDALNRAGKNQQIIILTCRTRTFSTLGGHLLQIQDNR